MYGLANNLVIAAINCDAANARQNAMYFLDCTTLGTSISGAMKAFGVLALLAGLAMVAKSAFGGRSADAVKKLVGAVVVATLLFSPGIIVRSASAFSSVTQGALCAAGDLLGGSDEGGDCEDDGNTGTTDGFGN